jgi:hypothetical protein
MKAIFLLDQFNTEGQLVAANIRAVEVVPEKLQLRQTGLNETWLVAPANVTDDLTDPKTTLLALCKFDVGIIKNPVPPVEAPAAPIKVEATPVKTKKAAKKAKGKAK